MAGYWQRTLARRYTRRQILRGAAVAAGAALGVLACRAEQPRPEGETTIKPGEIPFAWQLPDETPGAVPGGMIRFFYTNDITGGFDPYTTSSRSATLFLAGLAYEPLLQLRTGPGIDTSRIENRVYEGRLAERWEWVDPTTIVFKMRRGVYFHNIPPVNGREMDIDDWRVTIQRLQASPYRVTLQTIADLNRVEFPDSQTMVIRLNHPYAPGPFIFSTGVASFWVMPKEAADRMDPNTQVIGTNFRQLEYYQPSVTLRFKRHERYWLQGRPFLNRWDYPIITEKANRVAQFIAGNIHWYQPLPEDLLQLRKDVPNAVVYRAETQGVLPISFFGYRDLATAPWRDERVRQAISMVIDRRARFEYFRNHQELLANGIDQRLRYHTHFWAGSVFWLDWTTGALGEESRFFQYDLAEARRLLEAAGYPNGVDIDTWWHTGPNYGAQYVESAQIFNDMLQRSGLFRVRPHPITYQEYLTTVWQKRDFSGLALVLPWTGVDDDFDAGLYAMFHRKSGDLFRGLPDDQLEAMLDRQRAELDVGRRTQLMHELQRYLARKMYVIPTEGVYDVFNFVHPWVRNIGWPQHSWWLAPDAPNREG